MKPRIPFATIVSVLAVAMGLDGTQAQAEPKAQGPGGAPQPSTFLAPPAFTWEEEEHEMEFRSRGQVMAAGWILLGGGHTASVVAGVVAGTAGAVGCPMRAAIPIVGPFLVALDGRDDGGPPVSGWGALAVVQLAGLALGCVGTIRYFRYQDEHPLTASSPPFLFEHVSFSLSPSSAGNGSYVPTLGLSMPF